MKLLKTLRKAFSSCQLIAICFIIVLAVFITGKALALSSNAKSESGTCLSTCSKAAISRVFGRIQFVDAFPDYKVKIVTAFPDLKVQKVSAFASVSGKWKIVNSSPDYKIKIVDAFPDFTIKYVEAFPGVN